MLRKLMIWLYIEFFKARIDATSKFDKQVSNMKHVIFNKTGENPDHRLSFSELEKIYKSVV